MNYWKLALRAGDDSMIQPSTSGTTGAWQRAWRKWEQGELFSAAIALARRRVRRAMQGVRFSNSLYWLDPERVKARRYEQRFPLIAPHHRAYGNYYLDSRIPLDQQSVVYSLGVGGDVDFDHAVAKTHGCEVHLYDPTPVSIHFMARLKESSDPVVRLLQFHPVGAWKEDATLRFYAPSGGGSASAVVASGHGTSFDAPCLSVRTMMMQNGHSRIDVLKMDIEGAAEIVLEWLLQEGILPRQVVAEFERPTRDATALQRWFETMDRICARMEQAGYQATLLPRDRAKYFGVELLFARP